MRTQRIDRHWRDHCPHAPLRVTPRRYRGIRPEKHFLAGITHTRPDPLESLDIGASQWCAGGKERRNARQELHGKSLWVVPAGLRASLDSNETFLSCRRHQAAVTREHTRVGETASTGCTRALHV